MAKRKEKHRIIKRFIVWYLKRHNVTFEYENYTVRMFSTTYYQHLMHCADKMRGVNCRHSFVPYLPTESEGKWRNE